MENFIDGKTYFDVGAVAQMFKVHPETVKRWAREDKLEKKKGTGRVGYLFSEDSLEKFAAGNRKYSTNKDRYYRAVRMKREERADVLMDIMAKITRMKVQMFYDSAAGKMGYTEKYIEGWTKCADEFENYIREMILHNGL